MTMTAKEAAAALDGCQYRKEGSDDLWDRMKAAGLVAVFGASDDLVELRGAIYDELGAFEGVTFLVGPEGLSRNHCRSGELCPNFVASGVEIEALWCAGESLPCWTYRTEIPHETFLVLEDGDQYCRGIVLERNN